MKRAIALDYQESSQPFTCGAYHWARVELYYGFKQQGDRMATIKTDILLQDWLYEEASALANEMQIAQSEFFVLAIEDYLRRYRNQKLLQSINEAYADGLDPSEQAMLEGMRRHQGQLALSNLSKLELLQSLTFSIAPPTAQPKLSVFYKWLIFAKCCTKYKSKSNGELVHPFLDPT